MSDDIQFIVEALNPAKHRRAEFECESRELTEFLRARARKEMEARSSACYVLTEETDPGRIVGYYTLSQTSVELRELPEAMAKRLPRYPHLGATLIGRLARDIAWQGRQVGRFLLIDALRRCVRYSANVGAVVVVTDPKDEKARAFYASHGFAPLDERRMFMPMSALIEREKRGWDA